MRRLAHLVTFFAVAAAISATAPKSAQAQPIHLAAHRATYNLKHATAGPCASGWT